MTYRDNTPITQEDLKKLQRDISVGDVEKVAQTVATWLREKMYGKDVRETLAQWAIYTARIAQYLINDEQEFKRVMNLSLIHISEPTRQEAISDGVLCL